MERRSEMTKALLGESFKEQMLKKSFDKITVRMITDAEEPCFRLKGVLKKHQPGCVPKIPLHHNDEWYQVVGDR